MRVCLAYLTLVYLSLLNYIKCHSAAVNIHFKFLYLTNCSFFFFFLFQINSKCTIGTVTLVHFKCTPPITLFKHTLHLYVKTIIPPLFCFIYSIKSSIFYFLFCSNKSIYWSSFVCISTHDFFLVRFNFYFCLILQYMIGFNFYFCLILQYIDQILYVFQVLRFLLDPRIELLWVTLSFRYNCCCCEFKISIVKSKVLWKVV